MRVTDEGEEGSGGRGWEGREQRKNLVENWKRNDLRDRRNRVAEYYGISDIKTFHRVDATEKYDGGEHVIKRCGSVAENKTCPNHFIQTWVIAIYLREANLIHFEKNNQCRIFFQSKQRCGKQTPLSLDSRPCMTRESSITGVAIGRFAVDSVVHGHENDDTREGLKLTQRASSVTCFI